MADYWKSTPRKYCEVCKCWFGDNKVSVDFHESGRRHQENVKKQLRQARAKHVENEKEQLKTAQTLAAIEQAAIQAYEKDLAVEYSGGSVQEASQAKIAQQVNNSQLQLSTQMVGSTSYTQQQQQQKEQENIKQQIQENIEKKLKELKKQQTTQQGPEEQTKWQQFTSPEGYPYYFNSETGVSQWEVPAELKQQQQQEDTSQEQQQLNTSTKNLKTKKKNSSANQSSTVTGHKRGAEQASVESSDMYNAPKRNYSPYGAWTTVSVASTNETTNKQVKEQESKEQDNKAPSSDEEEGQDDVMQIKEKTLSGLNVEEQSESVTSLEDKVSFKTFSFKKRTGNRPQIRQRTSDI